MLNFKRLIDTAKTNVGKNPKFLNEKHLCFSQLLLFKSFLLNEMGHKKGSNYLSTLLLWQDFHNFDDKSPIKEVFSSEKQNSIYSFFLWLMSQRQLGRISSLKHISRLLNLETLALNFTIINKTNNTNQIISPSNNLTEDNHTGSISKDALISINSPDGKNILETKLSDMDIDWEDIENEMGLKEYDPITISNTYYKGYFYYPMQSLIVIKDKDEEGKPLIFEKIETIVVRSDRTILRAVSSPLPDESRKNEQVYRLSDGTLIQSLPKQNKYSTWRWESINQFIQEENDDYELIDLIQIVHDHFYSRIWLPIESDYWMISLGMVLTYVQSIFEAVPLFLVTGPAGSGKSELGLAMSLISSNCAQINQTSPATMMRTMDEAGGLAVFDDLESIGINKSGKQQEKFSEIAQVLKISYKKSSASKMVMNQSTMRSEKLNFFGVKVVNNTRGADEILGSRMLEINTQHLPKEDIELFKKRKSIDEDILEETRDALHTWAFTSANIIHTEYINEFQDHGSRSEEIASPLRLLAKMTGSKYIQDELEKSLENQKRRENKNKSPEEALKIIIENLVTEGYRIISINHIVLELRRFMDPGYKIDYIKSLPGWSKPIWVGRTLRNMGLVVSSFSKRRRLHNSNLRFIKVHKDVVKRILSKNKNNEIGDIAIDELSFCTNCETCKYKNYQCEVKGERSVYDMSV